MRYAVCLEQKHKSKILAAAGNYDLIVVDSDFFTAAEIRQLKSKGAKVLTYLNVGAIENTRSYFAAAKRSGLLLGKYDNWPGEYWVAAQKAEWREVILGLATVMRAKGVDGFWVDNLDIMYTAEEEYKWSKSELATLYTNLQNILASLHEVGYVMINGGDVFVSRAIKTRQAGNFDGVNQETVITCIRDYDPPGKFGRQAADEREYYEEYMQEVRMAEKDIYLLEYATDQAIIAECNAYARAKGYSLCVSGNIELGGDIVTNMANGPTVWDMQCAIAKFDGSPTAHDDTYKLLKAKGHSVKMSDAWCTEQLMAIFYTAGAIGLIGGYHRVSDDVQKAADGLGIWHSTTKNLKPFCPVIFGENGDPNHSEISVGFNINVSGNYTVGGKNGTSRREWKGRHVMGFITPKYSPMPAMDNFQIAVVSSDVILGVYGTRDARTAQLAVWGADNRKRIQDEVNRVWGDEDKIVFNMAVATIGGFMGKGEYRTKRLGKWADKVQARINKIYALRGKSNTEAAKLGISGAFGNGAIRVKLLTFCGYNAEAVQKKVNELV